MTNVLIGGIAVNVAGQMSFNQNREEQRDSGHLYVLSDREKPYQQWMPVDVGFKNMQYLIESDTVIKYQDVYMHDITVKETIGYFDTIYPADREFRFENNQAPTIKQVLDVYKEELVVYQKISIDYDALDAYETNLPEKQFNGNFSDILTNIFRRIKAIPRAKLENGVFYIYPEYYAQRNAPLNIERVSEEQRERNVVNHATEVISKLKNAVNENGLGTWYPNSKSWATPRSELRRAPESSSFIDVDGRIWGIYKAYAGLRYSVAPVFGDTWEDVFPIDVTNRVLPKELYDLIPQEVPLNEWDDYKNTTNSLYFEIGGDKIEGLVAQEQGVTRPATYSGVIQYDDGIMQFNEFVDYQNPPVLDYVVDTATDVDLISNPSSGDVARTKDTMEEYEYDGEIWVGLGGAIRRYRGTRSGIGEIEDINAPFEGDRAVETTAPTEYEYQDGVWVDLGKVFRGFYDDFLPGNAYEFLYRMRYISQRDIDLIISKHNVSELIAASILNQQGDSVVDVTRQKSVMHTLANRLGNKDKTFRKVFDITANIPELGDYTNDNYILTSIKYTIENDIVNTEFRVTQNFNLIDATVSVSRRPDPFSITTKSVQTNPVLREYVEFSLDEKTNENTTTKEALRLAFLRVLHVEKANHVVEDALLIPQITDFPSGKAIHMPVEVIGDGNTLLMHVRMKSPTFAGNQLDYRGSNDYWRKVQRYTEEDGRLEFFTLKFDNPSNYTDDIQVMDYPLVDDKDTFTDIPTLPIRLSPNASLGFSYQLEAVTDYPEDVIITEKFTALNSLVQELNSQPQLYKSSVPFNVFDEELRPSDELISGSITISGSNPAHIHFDIVEQVDHFCVVRDNKIIFAVNNAHRDVYVTFRDTRSDMEYISDISIFYTGQTKIAHIIQQHDVFANPGEATSKVKIAHSITKHDITKGEGFAAEDVKIAHSIKNYEVSKQEFAVVSEQETAHAISAYDLSDIPEPSQTATPTITNIDDDGSELTVTVRNNDSEPAKLQIGDTTAADDQISSVFTSSNATRTFTYSYTFLPPATIYARAKADNKTLSDYDSYNL